MGKERERFRTDKGEKGGRDVDTLLYCRPSFSSSPNPVNCDDICRHE
jgi:hypothetical protein